MNIDKPQCNLKTCRYCHDHNCFGDYERCEYTLAKRPHGKWIFKNDNPLIKMGYWECSKCKTGRLMVEENFCPNCGADMRKDGDEK